MLSPPLQRDEVFAMFACLYAAAVALIIDAAELPRLFRDYCRFRFIF